MIEHRFSAGQTLKAAASAEFRDLSPGELLEIVATMPSSNTGLRYRVRVLRTGLELILKEYDLEAPA